MKKKEGVRITSPDELDKHLQSSSPATWIVLGAAIGAMLAFFVWSFLYKIPVRLSGSATVEAGQATLVVNEQSKDKLAAGQKIYILDQEGVLAFDGDQPVVYNLNLDDGNYTYRTDLVIREIRPIEFLLNK